ncbi:MAG: NAD(P)H-dependent glycerol-3-phosphate dehydrogenase [Burkholderiaceae bacterium]
MRIAVFGAGAWGTAIASHLSARHEVCLWARDAALVAAMRRERQNGRYLPGVQLPSALLLDDDFDAVCGWLGEGPREPSSGSAQPGGALAVVGTPVAGLRPTLAALDTRLPAPVAGVVWLCKGIEAESGLLPHQVAAEVLPRHRAGVLSGPSFAQEVAAGLPVALTLAAADAGLRRIAQAAFHHEAARIYGSDDVVGVELGGALKNVMAVAAGICDGLALGMNARAALITRGLAEISRLGRALGARAETFMGLTGLGDLVLTCTGDLSRNRRVGLALAAGEPLPAIVARLGHVAEGVRCADAAQQLAARCGVEMPIVDAVRAVLSGRQQAREAVLALMAREQRAEHEPLRESGLPGSDSPSPAP